MSHFLKTLGASALLAFGSYTDTFGQNQKPTEKPLKIDMPQQGMFFLNGTLPNTPASNTKPFVAMYANAYHPKNKLEEPCRCYQVSFAFLQGQEQGQEQAPDTFLITEQMAKGADFKSPRSLQSMNYIATLIHSDTSISPNDVITGDFELEESHFNKFSLDVYKRDTPILLQQIKKNGFNTQKALETESNILSKKTFTKLRPKKG